MKTILIEKNHFLTDQKIFQLMALSKKCQQYDGEPPKIYWDNLKTQYSNIRHFLAYQENILIGYCGFFPFEADSVYLSAVVDPQYRQQGLFSQLFNSAVTELKNFNIFKIKIPVSQQEEYAKKYVISLGGSYLYTEYFMERHSDQLEFIDNFLLSIRQATFAEVELIAQLDVSCFNSEYFLMLERFKEVITDAHRQIWLAYLGNECIGKVHIRFEEERVFIHDLGIIPEQQKKGYGLNLLKWTVNHLIRELPKICLEVESNNESALQIYQKCHFVETAIYEYWGIQFK